MTNQHQPDPEFVSRLEWQVRTAHQRQDRFSLPMPPGRPARARTVLLVLASAFVGAGAVVASEEVQESRAQELLLVRVQGQERIAALQVEMAAANLGELRRQANVGVIGQQHLAEGEIIVLEAESHLLKLRLDEEEIRASGRAPRDEVSAPLVGGRDFVTERLRLRLNLAETRFSAYQERLSRTRERVRLGVLPPETEEARDQVLMEVESEIESLLDEMALRQRFLRGEISAVAVETALERRRTEAGLRRVERTYDRMRQETDRVAERVELGLLPQSEQERMELNLLQVGLEMETLRRTLELLRTPPGGGRQ